MNILIGKIKSEFKIILSQKKIIIPPIDFSKVDGIDFNPNHNLEGDEWWQIKDFSKQQFYIEECGKNYSTTNLNSVTNGEYQYLDCLCIFQNGQKYFQRIAPALYVNKKTLLDFSGQPTIVNDRKQIEIRSEPDVCYVIQEDILYFKNLSKIKNIFPSIEKLYREATQEEVNSFFKHKFIKKFIKITNTYSLETVGQQNRKRIADIREKLLKLSSEKQKKIIQYARNKSDIELKENIFLLKSDSDLKKMLYAMDQRYYNSEIYNEERIATSIRLNPKERMKK